MGKFFSSNTRLGKIENRIELSKKRASERALRIYRAEQELRELWTAKGVPESRQLEMLADITAKSQPGAKIGPFTLGGAA